MFSALERYEKHVPLYLAEANIATKMNLIQPKIENTLEKTGGI
jgi:hypothetical protein